MLALQSIVVLAASSYAVGQVTQTVAVGTFYNPPLLAAAALNDVIVFQFTAGTHGVTQSDMLTPCVQLEGGFNSGLIAGNTADPPTWNLTVTNISAPIWFFCQATTPFSHCANGMVGAINAPLDQYASFTSAAKTVTGTPAPQTSLVLTGQGAFASAPPTSPTITSAPASSTTTSSTTTSSSSTTTSPAPTSSSKSSSNGAAIGGGVGGGVAVLIIGILGFLLFRARRKQHKLKRTGPYAGPETGMMQQHFDPSKEPGNVSFVASQRTGGSEGAGGAGLMFQPGVGVTSLPFDQYNNGRASMGGAAYMHQNQNLGNTGNFDGPGRVGINRDVAVANAGGYAASEPASDRDTNERDRDFVGPLPPNSPMGSLGGSTAAGGGYNDPRSSTYTEGAGTSSGYKSPRRTESDVKEIAKEVAELLLPQLRAHDPSRMTPPATTSRQLPLPVDGMQPPEQPRSPGPPQYERYNL